MAVTASSVGTGDTLETFRQEFNNAVVDLGNLDSASVSSISISANNFLKCILGDHIDNKKKRLFKI